MFATADLRREVLRGFVEGALREGGATNVVVEVVPADRELGYRRRARLHVERGRIGWRVRRSDRLLDVERCLVLDDVLSAALAAIRAEVLPLLAGSGELRLAHGGSLAVAALEMDDPQPPEVYRACEGLVPRLAGVGLDAGRTGTFATFGDPRERTTAADGLPLEGTVGGFSQAHDEINTRLAAAVVELAAPAGARVLELYAGTGNLSVMLAPAASSFVAVEEDRAASESLRRNLTARGIAHAKVIAGDAASEGGGGAIDVIVLDPPRTGAKDALAAIAARRPQRIVYVSCDTATLGRDLARLRDLGFITDRALAFEMFPQTSHVETVVRLQRA
jgi:23S rRNA (uracil1939-C5)-methyltransferase